MRINIDTEMKYIEVLIKFKEIISRNVVKHWFILRLIVLKRV